MSKTPQILQNANRYSNESSRRNKLICLKGFLANEKEHFDNQKSQKHVKTPQIFCKMQIGTQTKALDETN